MVTPTLTYTTDTDGVRRVSISGTKVITSKSAAPAGTHDLKTAPSGIKLLSIAGDLPEPLDVAEMRGRI